MRLISCAGYYGSGSSAITDLITEYADVKSLTDYEFRFMQDIDGITDLEYHLVHNHHRHNAGHAIKRFLKLSEFNAGTWFNSRYEPFFGGNYLKITKDYINSLTEIQYPGYWFMDLYDRGRFIYYLKSLESKIRKRIPFLGNSCLPKEITYCSHPTEEQFLILTRQYISNLIKAANPDNSKRLVVDQLLPSSGINQCLRYFDCQVNVLIVDRDPRDVYLLDKYIFKTGITPRDPHVFCEWFKYTHNSNRDEIPNPKNVMSVQFEDLIFHYAKEKKKIEKFLGLSEEEHISPFSKLNPCVSVHNTQLWKVYGDALAMSVIEKELPDYLFDFDSTKECEICGIQVEKIKRF